MKPVVIQTGSSGNCVILNNVLALDMGVTIKKVAPYIPGLQLVFVSHEHSDHFKAGTIRTLARQRPALRFCCGPFLAEKFLQAGVGPASLDIIQPGTWYDYGAFRVSPVELHHNVPNYGLKIQMDGERAIYMTDTGYVDDVQAQGYELFMLEANHGEQEIRERIEAKRADGIFPYEVETARNHLSYEQAMDWLVRNAGPDSRYVFLHQHQEKSKAKQESNQEYA